MKRLLNCTPHEIKIIPEEGKVISIPPSGVLIRIATEEKNVGTVETEVGTIPVVAVAFKEITFTKDGKEMDEKEIRNEKGQIEGVPSLVRV